MKTQTVEYTPGPWRLTAGRTFETTNGEFFLSYDYDSVSNPEFFGSACELDANARLIAAAPELLEALLALVQWIEDNSPVATWCDQLGFAHDAIAKAKGKK